MQVAMGDLMLTCIPNIENVECLEQKPPATNLCLLPAQLVIHQYDLWLVVTGGNDQVTLFHQAFLKWYQKVREVDSTVILYPWSATDWNKEKTRFLSVIMLSLNRTKRPTLVLVDARNPEHANLGWLQWGV